MDEVLTPDSLALLAGRGLRRARAGTNPPSYDKQFVRDWLEPVTHRRQALGQDAAGAAPAGRGDRARRRPSTARRCSG